MLSRLLKSTLSLCGPLAILAGPLLAAEPAARPAKPAAEIVQVSSPYFEAEYPPPAPLAPLPYSSQAIPGEAGSSNSYYTARGNGAGAIYGTPGGYEARIGSPYHYFDPNGGQYVVTGDPYYDHFGPGFHRHSLHGHYRFPYYNYRAPWYYPGRAVYNRDTNFPW